MSSNSDIAIAVRNLGKCYRIYDRPQDRLKQGLFRRRQYFREFWALKDVSFEVRKGETVGVIGRNGSGKSTLLQLIARILTPTTGDVTVNGRVAALLELGSGFNPEFSGRENIYMNGAILGLSREEIEGHFPAIAAFADIGEFIDQPVKTYSSGMVVRLAFAVQAMVAKDILIVDEALAVGDEAFQRKCFAKLDQFKKQGGTILFVSHAGGVVVQLCDSALLLDRGELLLTGDSKRVVTLYQRLIYSPASSQERVREELRRLAGCSLENADAYEEEPAVRSIGASARKSEGAVYDPDLVPKHVVRYESRGARIGDLRLTSLDGQPVNILVQGESYIWRYRVTFDQPVTNVRFGMMVKTLTGLELGGAVTHPYGKAIGYIEPGTSIDVQFEFRAGLTPGTYFLNAGVVAVLEDEEVFLDRWVDVAMLKILPEPDSLVTGIVDLDFKARVAKAPISLGTHVS